MSKWQPPETAPKDGTAFEITTAGPGQDFCFWDKEKKAFVDYYHRQTIVNKWPYMVAWRRMRKPAKVCDTEEESRAANGFPLKKVKRKS